MSDKYKIIKCPAFVLMRTATSGTYFDMCGYAKGHIKCADRTDCLLKQIVEKCKNTQFLSTKNRQDLYAVKVFANDLLQLLDIQEVE